MILWQVLGRRGLIARFRASTVRMPAREILVFTIPLLTTDLVYIFLNTSDAILLEHFKGLEAVASWRVVQPAAGLNTLVISSFTVLFTPMAARLYARRDRDGVARAVLADRDLDGGDVVPAVRTDLQHGPGADPAPVRPPLRGLVGLHGHAVVRLLLQHRPRVQRADPADLRGDPLHRRDQRPRRDDNVVLNLFLIPQLRRARGGDRHDPDPRRSTTCSSRPGCDSGRGSASSSGPTCGSTW